MNKSETIGQLIVAITKAKKNFKPITKNKSIKFGSTDIAYADMQSMIEATQDALGECELNIFQIIHPEENHVVVESILAHSSGEFISSKISLPLNKGAKNSSQDYGGVVTYARRYSYMGLLCISPCDDSDAGLAENMPIKDIAIAFVKPTTLTHQQMMSMLGKQLDMKDVQALMAECGVTAPKDIPADKLNSLLDKIRSN
jgi:hypothetical protein